MYTLNDPPNYVGGVLREHLARAGELLADLRPGFLGFRDMGALEGACQRCVANLDALRVAGSAAIAVGRAAMEDDADAACVVALLLAESDGAGDEAVSLLRHASPDIRQAAWWGLRLADVSRIIEDLRAVAIERSAFGFASAAAWNLLAFHRHPVHVELSRYPTAGDDEIAWLLADASGRMPVGSATVDLQGLIRHSSKRVRAAALRASARCGLRELVPICQDATDRSENAEAIEFLGVAGSERDLLRLQRVATSINSPAAAKAATAGLGKLGLVAAMPTLLYLLDEACIAETAASAIARLTGEPVPRGPLPEPPSGTSEDDLDLWEPVAPVDAPRAHEWWASRAPSFDPKKRYQAGTCVSDDPLGPIFDRLPPAIRHDVYLRQRALVSGTPDWELETWPWRQKGSAT